MCVAHDMRCKCAAKSANFHFRDNILSEQVLRTLYCPSCSTDLSLDPESMIADNGWVVEYDMDIARFMGTGKISGKITPDTLFDDGYCTWNGIYPGDHIDSVQERGHIASLAKIDPKEYLRQMKSWASERQERLKGEGWRKAHAG